MKSALESAPERKLTESVELAFTMKDVLPYLEPKSATTGIDIGCLVEIVSGAFKGEKARVLAVADTKEEISMELYEADIPMTLNMRADHVRVIERIE